MCKWPLKSINRRQMYLIRRQNKVMEFLRSQMVHNLAIFVLANFLKHWERS